MFRKIQLQIYKYRYVLTCNAIPVGKEYGIPKSDNHRYDVVITSSCKFVPIGEQSLTRKNFEITDNICSTVIYNNNYNL